MGFQIDYKKQASGAPSTKADAVWGCEHDRLADEVRRTRVSGSYSVGGRGHVHAGTTNPAREGAAPARWRAPATEKEGAAGSDDHSDR